MDKTVSISLGGYAFTLDEAAYSKLKSYLDDIRRSLNNTEGLDEIISDVEIRIAELLQPSTKNKDVINVNDVDGVISVMGKPEQYNDEEMDEETSRTAYTPQSKQFKKLFRDKSNAWIGGVCSGLARYFNADVLWIRLIFLAPLILDFMGLFFFDLGGMAFFMFITYVIMWIIVPEARSTSDRLSMQGKPVNFDSIKEFGEKTADNVSKVASDAKPFAGRLVEVIGKIFFVMIGIWLLFKGIGLIIGGLVGSIGSIVGFFQVSEFTPYFFDNSWVVILGINLIAICLLLFGMALVMVALRLFSKRYKLKGRTFLIMGVIWLACFIGAAIIGITYSSNFWHNNNDTVESNTYTIENDTIQLSLEKFKDYQNNNNGRWNSFDSDFFVHDDKLFVDNIDVKVYKTTEPDVTVQLQFDSQGRNSEDAIKNSNLVNYNYTVEGNHIKLDEFYTINKGEKFRAQTVKVNIYIPEGKTLYSKNIWYFYLYNDENDYEGSGRKNRYYQFLEDGIDCLNCNDDDNYKKRRRNREHSNWEHELEEELKGLEYEIEEQLRDLDLEDTDIKNFDLKINDEGLRLKVLKNNEEKEIRINDVIKVIKRDTTIITDDNDTIRLNFNRN